MAHIEYRMMKPEDGDQVRELLYTYWRAEPLAMALHIEVPRECKRYVDYALGGGLYNGISAVAVDRTTGNIVGIMLCVATTRGNWDDWTYSPGDKDCEKLKLHSKISSRLDDGLDVFEMYGVDTIGEGIAVVINKEYAGSGVATKVADKGLRLLSEHGIPIFVGEVFSFAARFIALKLGMKIIREVKYEDYIAAGILDMPNNSPHKSMVLAVKILDPEKRRTIPSSQL